MRDYGKVYGTFWSSQTTGCMSDDGKLLALYLMTCPHSTIAGVFRLPDGYVSEDLGWPPERVKKGLGELLANGFANRCETTKWVWILKHLDWNKPENPNQRKSAAKIALSVPDECAWKVDFIRECGPMLEIESEPLPNPSETVAKPLLNQKQEQKQEQKKKSRLSRLPDGFGISDRVLKWATEHGLAGVIELHLEAFVSTCRAKGYEYIDWDEAFMNAMRKNWAKIEPPRQRSAGGALKVAV